MTEEEYTINKIKLEEEIAFYSKHFPLVTAERKRRLQKLEKEYNE